MLNYDEINLLLVEAKTGGKNKSDVDGFYREVNKAGRLVEGGREFFVKKPADKAELFAELFAGLLLQQFMEHKLIDPIYFPSLICADFIRFQDGSYGLIQPKVAFIELYKLIGTGSSDRSPLTEMFFGPSAYQLLTQQGDYFGLSLAIMFSLLLGDNSVHSGNVVILKNGPESKTTSKQFARIDWGAAFRNFANPKNNENILIPAEYQGWFNFKWFTKGYIANYKNIPGLFTAVAEKGKALQDKLNTKLLIEMVSNAAKKIPADMLDEQTKSELADYMCIPSFKTASFGKEGRCEGFVHKFVEVLGLRLEKIADLQEQCKTPKNKDCELLPPQNMYSSIRFTKQTSVLSLVADNYFPEQMQNWLTNIEKAYDVDFTQIDISSLARNFNYYVDLLAHQAEIYNLWEHDNNVNQNMFIPYSTQEPKNAFVTQYRESTILRRLYNLNPETFKKQKFRPYGELQLDYGKAQQDSSWVKITAVLNASHNIIETLKPLQEAQNQNKKADIREPLSVFKGHLIAFSQSYVELVEHFKHTNDTKIDSNLNFESTSFYPISDEELNEMSGDQLATIYLEELRTDNPSTLVTRIIKDKQLTIRTTASLTTHKGQGEPDNLIQLRVAYVMFVDQKNKFDLAEDTNKKIDLLQKLDLKFKTLPGFLQRELKQTFDKAKNELALWEENQRVYLEKEALFKNATNSHATKIEASKDLREAFLKLPKKLQDIYEKDSERNAKEVNYLAALIKSQLPGQSFAAKIEAYGALKLNLQALPEDLLLKYQPEALDYLKEATYLNCLASYKEKSTVSARIAEFPTLSDTFKPLSSQLKQVYQASYDQLQGDIEAYEELIKNKLTSEVSLVAKIDSTLERLQTGRADAQKLKEAALADPFLWQAIAATKKGQLSQGVVQDLLILKKFHDDKIILNVENKFGEDYSSSIDRFYQDALKTRLSGKPPKDQAQHMITIAQREFQPRHSTRRLIGDVIMLFSILCLGLGLGIGLYRKANDKTFFFSTMPTDREWEFTKDLLKPNAETESDEDSLLNAPRAAASA